MIILSVLLGISGIVVILLIVHYDRLIRLRKTVREGWGGLDLQLRRRTTLVPEIVESVQAAMGDEHDLLKAVKDLLARSVRSEGFSEKQQAENDLTGGLARLFAMVASDTELEADRNFQDLQRRLSEIEDRIQLARRYYNGTVRNLNAAIGSFPGNLLAGWFAFRKAAFFEIQQPAEQAARRKGV